MTFERTDVELAARGDATAFTRLYKSIYKDLYRLAYFSLSGREDAEDAVSEAVTDAWRGLARLKDAAAFEGWMITILMRKCSALLKERYQRFEVVEKGAPDVSELDSASERAAAQMKSAESRSDLIKSFSALEDIDRQIISLCVTAGYTSAEAGEMLSMNPATVRSRLNRALSKVRNMLED